MKKITALLFFILILACPALAQEADLPAQETGLPAEEAVNLLKAGNAHFVKGEMTNYPVVNLREQTMRKQQPFAVILTCSDSRVIPETIFDRSLGDLFVVRVPGNVMNYAVAGGLEYGVKHLHAPLLVVLGHTKCGAVSAIVDKSELEGNLPALTAPIVPAVQRVRNSMPPNPDPDELLLESVKENARQAADDLYIFSPAIQKLVLDGKLTVKPAVYDISTGEVLWLDPRVSQ